MMHTSPASSSRRGDALALLALCLATVAAYWGVWEFGFFDFDDPDYVSKNAALSLGLGREFLAWAFWSSLGSVPHYIPVTWLAVGVQHHFFGMWAGGYHAVNLALHAGNMVLLYLLARRMGGSPRMAFLAAGLFGLHPLRVESVAWITEIKDVLSTAFWLGCLHAYASWVRERQASRRGWFLALAALGMLLAGLAKPMAATVPVTLLCLDFWPLGRTRWWRGPDWRDAPWWRLLAEKWPFFLIALLLGVWAVWTAAHGPMATGKGLPLLVRLQVATTGSMLYLWKTIWPTGLAPFYPMPASFPAWWLALAGGVMAGISLLAWRWRTRSPGALMAWVWFLLTLAPVSGLLQAGGQFWADRFSYVPLMGAALLAGFAMGTRQEGTGARLGAARWAFPLCCLALAALSVASFRQVRLWRSPEVMWRHALEVTEKNHVALSHVGRVHFERGEFDIAAEYFRKASEAYPLYVHYMLFMGQALREAGRNQEALDAFKTAATLAPTFPQPVHDLAWSLILEGRMDEAWATVEGMSGTPVQRAGLFRALGLRLLEARRHEDALRHFEAALALEPGSAETHNYAGMAAGSLRRYEDAIRHFGTAAGMDPQDEAYAANLAAARRAANRTAQP